MSQSSCNWCSFCYKARAKSSVWYPLVGKRRDWVIVWVVRDMPWEQGRRRGRGKREENCGGITGVINWFQVAVCMINTVRRILWLIHHHPRGLPLAMGGLSWCFLKTLSRPFSLSLGFWKKGGLFYFLLCHESLLRKRAPKATRLGGEKGRGRYREKSNVYLNVAIIESTLLT